MKIGIVGSGMVGATAAFAMVMQGIGREIILIDVNPARADAEADDLLHAVPFAHPIQITAGKYMDLVDCRVVIITAGVGQKPGETRLQLLGRNAAVFKEVIPNVLRYAPDAVLVIASNPVDIMTHLTASYAAAFGVPSSRIIGSGTTLDTARFRSLVGRDLGIDARHVHAYVLGEHGDSEVLNWSSVGIGGIPLEEFCTKHDAEMCAINRPLIDNRVRRAAYRIIEGKGATYYGVGSALARITRVILQDERSILTVCSPMAEIEGIKNVTVSVPHLVGGAGILDTLDPVMNEEETIAFKKSANIIRDIISDMEKEGIL
jgi:L-lactate dehydrogenase